MPYLPDPFGLSGRLPLIWPLIPLGLDFLEHRSGKDTCQEMFVKERREGRVSQEGDVDKNTGSSPNRTPSLPSGKYSSSSPSGPGRTAWFLERLVNMAKTKPGPFQGYLVLPGGFIEVPRCSEAILACISVSCMQLLWLYLSGGEGPLRSWKHLLSPRSSRNTSLLPALLSSDWGFDIPSPRMGGQTGQLMTRS